jgi:hypothetical protein
MASWRTTGRCARSYTVGENYVAPVSILCAGASDALFAAVLLTCLRRLVGVELEDEPASRLPIDVDVEKGARSVSSRHYGEMSSI